MNTSTYISIGNKQLTIIAIIKYIEKCLLISEDGN